MLPWIAAVVAGACFGLAPHDGLLAAPLWLAGLAGLALAVGGDARADLVRGALVGVLWYGISLRWVALEWVDLDGHLALPWVSWAGLVALQALVPAVGLGLAGALRARGWPRAVALGLTLAAAEVLAPWVQPLPGGLALYLAPLVPLAWPAAWLGIPALIGVAGAWAGLQVERPVLGALVLGVWVGVGQLAVPDGGEPVQVGVVQPNTGAFEARRPSTREARREAVVDAVTEAVEQGAELVVTPEGAWPDALDPRRPSTERALAGAFAGRSTVLLGASVEEVDGAPPTNSLVVVEGGAWAGRQDKVHLVPVSERAVLGLGRDLFRAGDRRLVLDAGPARVAGLVCFEDVMPSAGRGLGSADLLVAASNDAWLGPGPGSAQHLAASQLLALRTGRWVVRPTTNGRSAVVSPSGRIPWQAPWVDGDDEDAPGAFVQVAPVPLRRPWWAAADAEPWVWLVLVGVLAGMGWPRRPPTPHRS